MPRSSATSSDKLLSLLMQFADRSVPWNVDELARALSLPSSTTYRYLRALSRTGLVVAVSAGSYILGPTIILLDRQMRLTDPLLNSSRTVFGALTPALPQPGVLLVCRLFRESVMCVVSAPVGLLDIEVSYARGRALPLHRGAASKAILAHVPLRNLKALYNAAPERFADAGLGANWSAVRSHLRAIRKAMSSVTYGEVDRGAIGIASPIFGLDGQIIGSLGYVTRDKDEADVGRIVELVRDGARQLQDNLAAISPAAPSAQDNRN